MRPSALFLIASPVLALVWAGCVSSDEHAIDFNREIRPILNERCLLCHGGIRQQGDFSLLFEEDALAPTESGRRAIFPGKAHRSELIRRVTHPDPDERMPQDAAALSSAEVDLLTRWIDQGARWEKHWAYVPPNAALSPPAVEHTDWPEDGIDAFILAKLEARGLTPSPRADQAALIRRLSLDLIGLPPSPEEAQAFLNNPAHDAYEQAVDRLLASPHFGERWASMWLDLARYADSKGYEKDITRIIWKYRDWVIDAFNRDLPFDRFTIEQLAGDLLPDPTEQNLIATAFHRNTMDNDEGGTDNEEFRIAALIDRVGTTFEIWQATTMACVQCHSHPYDPFRQADFYRAFDFFNQSEDWDLYNEQPKLYLYEPEQAREVETLLDGLTARLQESHPSPDRAFLHDRKEALLYAMGLRKVQAEEFHDTSRFIELNIADQRYVTQIQDTSWILFRDVDLTDVTHVSYHYSTPLPGAFIDLNIDAVDGRRVGALRVTSTGGYDRFQTVKMALEPVEGRHDVYFIFRADQEYAQELLRLDWVYYHERRPRHMRYDPAFNRQLLRLAAIAPVPTPIMQERPPDRRRTTRVFHRGNWLAPEDTVTANVPPSVMPFPDDLPRNRLGLAQWLVHPDNPLTARVMVNRFWEQLFGRGLVETLEDFGTQGAAPSHPELLDWLAVQFVDEHQWGVKALLKQIVMSATYQQTARVDSVHLIEDPQNILLGRSPRTRLSAEQIRDQILAVSGLLDAQVSGPSVLDTPDPAYGLDFPVTPYRRSLYTFWRRTHPVLPMTTFDSPMRLVCTSRRIRTNTPLQALTLLNNARYFEAAQALATLMDDHPDTDVDAALRAGYQRVLVRDPGPDRLAMFRQLYEEAYAHYHTHPAVLNALPGSPMLRRAALTVVANAMLNLDAFITRP